MARRKELAGIAKALISSFNGRNNDFGGYWAIGKLKSFSMDTKLDPLIFDLFVNMPISKNELLNQVPNWSTEKLKFLLNAQHIPNHWVYSVTINLQFGGVVPEAHELDRCALGEFYRCWCEIIDDRGNKFAAEYGFCLPHSPDRELRRSSTRGFKL